MQVDPSLGQRRPFLWINPHLSSNSSQGLSLDDIKDAEARLQRFAKVLVLLFPELVTKGGMIESELINTPNLGKLYNEKHGLASCNTHFYVKADHALPVAGSIKARGGIYEVLQFAEKLSLDNGILDGFEDNYEKLVGQQAKELFSKHTISVGSTGNLGLSIGIISTALGFQAVVHMSIEAKQWKKELLRKHGAVVVEHKSDYSVAVAEGRTKSNADPFGYFVDDENSKHLFLGYAVAALRLQRQLQEQGVVVDKSNPLVVYLPCGVGGAPGGVTFGLKKVFGENVHCFFAEPTEAPCMMLAYMMGEAVSVYSLDLTVKTEADGLAVGTASALVLDYTRELTSGCFTVLDDDLMRFVYHLKTTESMTIEPSAAAGFLGPILFLSSESGQKYRQEHGTDEDWSHANHIVWTTGGLFVPSEEYNKSYIAGECLVNLD